VPPNRRGGLVKYSLDLAKQQKLEKDEVYLLIPGYSNIFINSTYIKDTKEYKGIKCYLIINPSLIPLYEGIKNPKDIINPGKSINQKNVLSFLIKIKPVIIHIHTLMGLPIEFVNIANKLNIRIIFTTHDYFGLCPKVNLMDNYGKKCFDNSGINCPLCCTKSPSYFRMMYIYNSNFSILFKKYFKKQFSKIRYKSINRSSHVNNEILEIDKSKIELFKSLKLYYQSFFSQISYFHFNSSVSKNEYTTFLKNVVGTVVPITHAGIFDNRKIKNTQKPIKIGFIGSTGQSNGFPILFKILDKIYNEGIVEWELIVFNEKDEKYISGNINYVGVYKEDQTDIIFNAIDVLVVPRNETFSFIVLEAISYGVPVIVSDSVGAKMIINNYNSEFIYKSQDELQNLLKRIIKNPEHLNLFNQKIIENDFSYLLKDHSQAIKKYIYCH